MEILQAKKCPIRRGSADWFTGAVWLDEIAVPPQPARVRVYSVTFEPGARTAWHSHTLGQILYITHGVGRVQREGGPVIEVRAGDAVCIAPQERHRHGAAPDHLFIHVAVQEAVDGTTTNWYEHVEDSEYAQSPSSS